jgi:squalene-hopene/tetraprenyl-beta-curcumene cyclase
MPNKSPKTILDTRTTTTQLHLITLDTATRVKHGIHLAQNHLLSLQKPDGHWIAELTVDSTLHSDWIYLMHWLGEIDFSRQAKLVKGLIDRQLPDGGWNIYEGGPSEVNASVKAYFALKLAGISPDEPLMRRAQANIMRLGGVPKMNTYNKMWLALFGQFSWQYLPIIPVEMILLPPWFYFSIYDLSSWSRAMLVPLSIINHFRPTKHIPPEKHIHELFPYGTETDNFSLKHDPQLFTWRNFFLRWDYTLKLLDKLPWKPLRASALKHAEQWILDRVGQGSDGLGAIFPAIVFSLMALKCLGYSDDHPAIQKIRHDLQGLDVEDPATGDLRIQPCLSPVWDTAITTVALAESGLPTDHPALQKAAHWLTQKEIHHFRGDWKIKNPHPEASGWAFEYNNIYYPDVDDTAKVLLALRLIDWHQPDQKQQIIDRATRWLLSFQCKDGGWAAFDKDVTKKWLEDVPFADHNAILDPTCSDITAKVLECLGKLGFPPTHPAIRRGVQMLKRTQERDGSWWGRWGVNYIYGTFQALRGLQAVGQNMNQDWIIRARDWLESCQNPDGGWGETCASYDDPSLKGKGPSTASQTAWAIMGLVACGNPFRPSLQAGIRYLLDTQNPDGSWTETQTTGTGFPKVFYLRYDMYRNNWPLMALGAYEQLRQKFPEDHLPPLNLE